MREGFRAVKCAPFDEMSPGDAASRAQPGIRRVAAVRDAVGADVTLLVDCHSRFDVESAVIVAEELAEFGVGWFEEPVQPMEDPEGMARIAARVPVPVAGGEKGYGEELFADLVGRGSAKIIMPDVKHCGGAAVAARAGQGGDRRGRRGVAPQPVGAGLAAGQRSRHSVHARRHATGARRLRGGLEGRSAIAARAGREWLPAHPTRRGTGRGAGLGRGAAAGACLVCIGWVRRSAQSVFQHRCLPGEVETDPAPGPSLALGTTVWGGRALFS